MHGIAGQGKAVCLLTECFFKRENMTGLEFSSAALGRGQSSVIMGHRGRGRCPGSPAQPSPAQQSL